MENILFKSYGIYEKTKNKMKLVIFSGFVLGVILLILSSIEVKNTEYFVLTYDGVIATQNLRDRIILLYIGIVLIAFSVTGLIMIKKLNNIYINIYEDYLEGTTYYFAFRNFRFYYDEIIHIEKQNTKLEIKTKAGNIGIPINGDIDEAYRIIQNKIRK